ncbi:GNAT family N-acetyltransferase [Arthrobacter dokdonensis]|uniref:GNAT family N-acetyltransferase n=1 Tax=Arthrobacter dokdonellae TaxID=2211210 RepID=UPI000DE5AA41|nr:GNAT family N-acetyltransferase [Arthrobacter dokdonellae]
MTHAAQPPVGLDELESLMHRAWLAPERESLDGWVMRSAGSVTQRANSVWPSSAPPDLDAALGAAAAWYASRRQPVTFQLTDRPENAALDGLLDRQGYSRQSETVIMTAVGPGPVQRAAGHGTVPTAAGPGTVPTAAGPGTVPTAAGPGTGAGRGAKIRLSGHPSEEWLDLWWRVDGRGGAAERDIARSILLGTPSVYASAVDGAGAVLGTGRLSVLDCWGGVYCMAVHPEFRRQGLATAVLGSLMEAGRRAGASRFWLMVAEANVGARGLYERAGFAEWGRYHYRQAPLRRASSAGGPRRRGSGMAPKPATMRAGLDRDPLPRRKR